MKRSTVLLVSLVLWCTAGCSSVASSAVPDLAAVATVQFVETSWPVMLVSGASWVYPPFAAGVPPHITGEGGGTMLGIRSREGDTLVSLSFEALGNGTVAKLFASTSRGGNELSAVIDLSRPPGFGAVVMPPKAPHLMAPGEGLVLQLEQNGQSYQVSTISAAWTRPL